MLSSFFLFILSQTTQNNFGINLNNRKIGQKNGTKRKQERAKNEKHMGGKETPSMTLLAQPRERM
jgi:hypothetical protein